MGYTSTSHLALRKIVESGIGYDEEAQIQANETTNADLLEKSLAGTTNLTTNATRPNINGNRIGFLYGANSIGCISTIVGCVNGMPFTLIKKAANTSFGIRDAGSFYLNATWAGSTNDSLTLVWDGTAYYELGRADV